jgi:hypothetical protein
LKPGRARIKPGVNQPKESQMPFKPYPVEKLKRAHKRSTYHREEIERSDLCCCFHCRRTFPPSEIEEWWDDGDTAVCPRCGIDAVIGSASGFPVRNAWFRAQMRSEFFGKRYKL